MRALALATSDTADRSTPALPTVVFGGDGQRVWCDHLDGDWHNGGRSGQTTRQEDVHNCAGNRFRAAKILDIAVRAIHRHFSKSTE
jgi:hypothetical protein